jgi:hypothetical protein
VIRPQRSGEALGDQALAHHAKIDIGRRHDQIVDLQRPAGVAPGGAFGDDHLAQRGRGHIGTAVVGDDVDFLQGRYTGQQAQELLEVKEGELARLAILEITEAPGLVRRLGILDRHHAASGGMPYIGQRRLPVVERGAKAVDEDNRLGPKRLSRRPGGDLLHAFRMGLVTRLGLRHDLRPPAGA